LPPLAAALPNTSRASDPHHANVDYGVLVAREALAIAAGLQRRPTIARIETDELAFDF
jgi:hypothetical protein